jgi:hypothetical protein
MWLLLHLSLRAIRLVCVSHVRWNIFAVLLSIGPLLEMIRGYSRNTICKKRETFYQKVSTCFFFLF